MLDLLWGALVVVGALGAVALLVRALRLDLSMLREEDEAFWGGEPPIDNDDTTVIERGEVLDPGETQVIRIEPLILDVRPVEPPQVVMDELGEWNPADYTMEQPLVLGHVLTARAWRTLSARELGMQVVAA